MEEENLYAFRANLINIMNRTFRELMIINICFML